MYSQSLNNLNTTASLKKTYQIQPSEASSSISYFDPGLGNFRAMSTTVTNPPYKWSVLNKFDRGFVQYGTIFCAGGTLYPFVIYIDVMGNVAVWSQNQNTWRVI